MKKVPWCGQSDLTVLIPMAGAGSRFTQAGFKLPKPLIDVAGLPMIQRIIENLNIDAQYVFIVQKEHYQQYNLGGYLELMAPGCKVVQVDGLTAGAACTTLLAKEYINNDNHLLIANSDQIVLWDSCEFMYNMINANADGGILTFMGDGTTKWSYVKTSELGYVSEVAEKQVISDEATVGIYYYKRGSEYVSSAEEMINRKITFNSEYYVAPVYNIMIERGAKIKTFLCEKMWGIGTPSDLEFYLKYHLNEKNE